MQYSLWVLQGVSLCPTGAGQEQFGVCLTAAPPGLHTWTGEPQDFPGLTRDTRVTCAEISDLKVKPGDFFYKCNM